MEEGHIIDSSDKVILRDARGSDSESYVKWMNQGEWKKYDAPWETGLIDLSPEEIKVRFMELYLSEREEPRRRVLIADKDDKPIGWMNLYFKEKHEDTWFVGIDICEDEYLNKGLGTEALKLWIGYLFNNSFIENIGLKTYSFNRRMIKVAEKIGLEHRETEKDVKEWNGENVDRLFFSISRDRWESQKD